MTRDADQNEIDRKRVTANALNRLASVLNHTPTIYAKPVYDMVQSAITSNLQSAESRLRQAYKAIGMADIFSIMPAVEPAGSIVTLQEVCFLVRDILITDSATYVEAQDENIRRLQNDLMAINAVAA